MVQIHHTPLAIGSRLTPLCSCSLTGNQKAPLSR